MKLKLEKSRDGFEVLNIKLEEKSYYIGSKYNQERELEKSIKALEPFTEKDIYIVLGLGSLEYIKRLNEKKFKKAKILIIEEKKEIVEFMKKNSNNKDILSAKDIYLIEKVSNIRETMTLFIEDLNSENVKIISFGGYNKIFNRDLVGAYKEVKYQLVSNILEKNTRLTFENDWLINELRNSLHIHKSASIKKFKGSMKDIPAVIVSAGPSLSKNIEKLDKDKAYIFSGGRTLKTLLDISIDPDILNIIDGGEISYKLVEEYIEKTNSILCYNEMTNYKIVDKHKGKKMISVGEGFIKNFFGEEIDDINKGGSVANSMACLAAYLGFNPIIFIGQDLAYTDDKGHADIASYKNADVDGEKNYYSSNDVFVEDIHGQYVRTSLVLKEYIKAMEFIIGDWKDTTFIDATEGGAKIKGAEIKTLEVVMNSLPKLEKRKIEIEEEDLMLKKRVDDRLISYMEKMKELIAICKNSNILLEEFQRVYQSDFRKLKKVDAKINENEEKIMKLTREVTLLNNKVYVLMYEIQNDKKFVISNKDDKKMRIRKRLDMNKKIYDGIIDMCEMTIDEIEVIKDRIML